MSLQPHRPDAPSHSATGRLLTAPDGSEHWEVEHIDTLRPFLVSLLNASDVWAYVSTAGGLAAGRVSAERSLFPYETDDRLHHAAGVTGPLTLLRVGETLWQPFDPRGVAPGRTRRLRKAAEGHWLELEESAPDLGLTFRMRWTTSPRFGLVRRCTLEGTAAQVELLTALNLIPADVPSCPAGPVGPGRRLQAQRAAGLGRCPLCHGCAAV